MNCKYCKENFVSIQGLQQHIVNILVGNCNKTTNFCYLMYLEIKLTELLEL